MSTFIAFLFITIVATVGVLIGMAFPKSQREPPAPPHTETKMPIDPFAIPMPDPVEDDEACMYRMMAAQERQRRQKIFMPTPDPTGNAAFDAWRSDELARLKKEGEEVLAQGDKFQKFLDDVKRAKDKELFEMYRGAGTAPPAKEAS